MKKTVGILLAGGLSRRYGSPKAFAKIEGEYFYERAYQALDFVCDQVIIVTRPELVDRFPNKYTVITDLQSVAGQGPLAGIFSGMTTIMAEKYMILPCDMPFISRDETAKLLAIASPTVAITAIENTNEKIPLFSLWSGQVVQLLHEELQANQLRVMKFMEKLTTEWIDTSVIHEDPLVFRNVNQPDG